MTNLTILRYFKRTMTQLLEMYTKDIETVILQTLLFITVDCLVMGSALHPTIHLDVSSDASGRIWNGMEAKAAQFPYQGFLRMTMEDGRMGFCGGSLISVGHVLTAAHCCHGFSSITVFLGLVNLDEMSESYVQRYVVANTSFVIHQQYKAKTIENDICILTLPSQVTQNANVSTINLPESNDENPSRYNGQAATISGWGQSKRFGRVEGKLQWGSVTIKPHILCVLVYLFLNPVPRSQLCTSRLPYTGSCNGDSGGALTILDPRTNRAVQYGIVSWGVGDCSTFYPDVYTYVPFYSHWITDVLTSSPTH